MPQPVWDDASKSWVRTAQSAIAAKTANYPVVAADYGKIFSNRGAAGAVTFTLPALSTVSAGWRCSVIVEADQNVIVAAHADDVDKMVAFNDATADSVAFSTAAERIGGAIEAIVNDDGTKWLTRVSLAAETQTPTVAT